MHLITKKRLKNFYEKEKQAEQPLLAWYRIVRNSNFGNFAELRKTFPSADQFGSCTIFNIGGNKYRLITVIHYNTGKVFIRKVLTHKQYDQGKWKGDCGK